MGSDAKKSHDALPVAAKAFGISASTPSEGKVTKECKVANKKEVHVK